MHEKIPRLYFLWFSLPALVLIGVVSVLEYRIAQATGHVLYPIDDPYIHLAMARHLAQDGVFGVSLAGYSASSSAPGWTLLLAGTFTLFGIHEAIPLVLNGLAAIVLLFLITRWLYEIAQSVRVAIAGTILLSAIMPLTTIVMLGMEHTLHILLILLLVRLAIRILTEPTSERAMFCLFILGITATLFRYETMFAAAPLALIFFIRKSWRGGILLILSCALPVCAFGAINIINGWAFLPNPIVMKSAIVADGWGFARQIYIRLLGQLMGESHITVPFLLLLCAFMGVARYRNPFACRVGINLFVSLSALILHNACASLGWFYRYEGYLLALAFLALAYPAKQWLTAVKNACKEQTIIERIVSKSVVAVCFIIALFAFTRNITSVTQIVPGAKNLFDQQYQMGLFLQENYSGKTVAANDIGAMNYLADIYCLDLMGLGSNEPRRADHQHRWNPEFIDSWLRLHHTAVVAIYESWFRKVIPPHWIKVGEWTTPEKVTVADGTVSFFAITPKDAALLKTHLEVFSPKLPKGVQVNLK